MPAGSETSLESLTSERLRAAFAEEELTGLRMGMQARFVAFAVLGILPWELFRRGREKTWHRYLFPALDMILLAWISLASNPFDELSLLDLPAVVSSDLIDAARTEDPSGVPDRLVELPSRRTAGVPARSPSTA